MVELQVFRFQILVSLMLSAQTRDSTTAQAVANLKTLPNGLTVESIQKTKEKKVDQMICKVGFHIRVSSLSGSMGRM
jgi:endonuclease-3